MSKLRTTRSTNLAFIHTNARHINSKAFSEIIVMLYLQKEAHFLIQTKVSPLNDQLLYKYQRTFTVNKMADTRIYSLASVLWLRHFFIVGIFGNTVISSCSHLTLNTKEASFHKENNYFFLLRKQGSYSELFNLFFCFMDSFWNVFFVHSGNFLGVYSMF